MLVLAFFAVGSAAQAQNLIQNGSFESPVVGFQQEVVSGSTLLTPWIVSGSGDVNIMNGPANGGDYGLAQDGSNYLDLSGDGFPHPTLYQDFPTTRNVKYTLIFYIGSSSYYPPPQTIHVSLFENGHGYLLNTNLTPVTPSGNSIDWTPEVFVFTATTNVTRLQFLDTSSTDDNSSYIDNVSVFPNLGITMLPVVNISGTNGSTYQLEYIDAFGPSSAWQQLGTITVTNNPQYYFDQSAIGQPQRFYQLVQVIKPQ
jgi:hypothetical protein